MCLERGAARGHPCRGLAPRSVVVLTGAIEIDEILTGRVVTSIELQAPPKHADGFVTAPLPLEGPGRLAQGQVGDFKGAASEGAATRYLVRCFRERVVDRILEDPTLHRDERRRRAAAV